MFLDAVNFKGATFAGLADFQHAAFAGREARSGGLVDRLDEGDQLL